MGAKIEAMAATENKQTVLKENPSEASSDHELFAGEVPEELSERDVFVGNVDFYKFSADSSQTPAAQQPAAASQSHLEIIRRERFSTLQKILTAGILIIAIEAVLLYVLLKPLLGPLTDITRHIALQIPSSEQPVEDVIPPVEDVAQPEPQQVQEPEVGPPPTQSLSLKAAQNFYLQKDYAQAYTAYDQLRRSLPANAEEELLRDFLQLRMALCLKKTGDPDQAGSLFRTLLPSRSPVVRVVANYNLIFAEVEKKQFLKARTRAYQTIAIIGAVDFDKDWASLLQCDCHFLVAESMTRNILSLCDADKDLPGELWSDPVEVDPFANLNETQLRSFLNSGSEQLNKGLLGPQIQKLEHQDAPTRWSVVCHGPSIEELLARFAADAGLDISWAYSERPALEEGPPHQVNTTADGPLGPPVRTLAAVHLVRGNQTKDTIRKRPVSLYLPAATAQEIVTVAAGHVGLLARLDENGVVNVFNPAEYSSLSEHISLLIQGTISLWQRFLLKFHSDRRVPNAHFALGLLQAQRGQIPDSIAEYKLVANRFSQTSLAPFALLNSSKLKADLRDYSGAREDLTQLVEQYPDTEFYGQACLSLADATMKAGLLHEAGRLYRKVYYLGLSLELQTASALGAGRCSYGEQDYEAAAKWLTQYAKLAKDTASSDLDLAYFLLGKTNLALGKLQQACDAFQYALAGQLTREKYVETISVLVETQIQQENFVEALELLENMRSWQLSKAESVEMLLLKSKVLRSMGLVDKAIVALGDRAEYVPDQQLKVKVSFELANCYVARGDLELAHGKLTEILVVVEPGPLVHEIALKLADVCLKLDRDSQAISVCLRLLDSGPSPSIKQRALKILAIAYNRRRDYDKAASALLGRWNRTEATNEKTAHDGSDPVN